MKKYKWREGPPPCIGWWPASMARNERSIRWWDGQYWSEAALPYYTEIEAAKRAEVKNQLGEFIEWTDRWWL